MKSHNKIITIHITNFSPWQNLVGVLHKGGPHKPKKCSDGVGPPKWMEIDACSQCNKSDCDVKPARIYNIYRQNKRQPIQSV